MGYIMNLRKAVGHAPLIMTSACVLILNDRGQLLLQHRADNGFWSYPGGSLELGESFEQCARREVLEETGLICEEMTYFDAASGEEMHYTYPNGDEVYIAEHVFLCRKYHGEMRVQREEAVEQRFFDLTALPQPITPVNRGIIEKLVKRMGNKG